MINSYELSQEDKADTAAWVDEWETYFATTAADRC